MAAAASSRKKRKHLSLEEKVDLILYSEKHPELGTRAVAACYDIGKTQASDILKNKLLILTEFKSYGSTYKKYRKSKYAEVNEALFEWYNKSTSRNIHPNGPQLVAKAKEIAASMDIPHFEGSSGWLFKWKKRYNVSKMPVCGESREVSEATTTTSKKTMPEIVEGYNQGNIFNLDEMALYWKALPGSEFGEGGKQCCGCNGRLTVVFLASANGRKEKPVVIWSRERPQCFKGLDLTHLPVHYYHDKNAWMTGEILVDYLAKFNARMQVEKRSVLLFLGTERCYSPDLLEGKFSNVMLAFLPASEQPLELGITNTFKYLYRRLFLLHILAKMDASNPASQVAGSLDILSGVRWVGQAWEEVKAAMIQDCFQLAGISSANLVGTDNYDPVTYTDDVGIGMGSLISRVMGTKPCCSVDEYITGDDSLLCTEDESDSTRGEVCIVLSEARSEGDGKDPDVPLVASKLDSWKQAVESLENVRTFLDFHGHTELAGKVTSLMTEVAGCHGTTLTSPH